MTNLKESTLNGAAELMERLRACLQWADDEPVTSDSLIGLLQRFRPDGARLAEIFDDLPAGGEMSVRLMQLYLAAGDSARPGGGQDAYFIVRQPPALEPDEASRLVTRWLGDLATLARAVGADDVLPLLDPLPNIRVLEGIAPKQSKSDLESVPLYRLLKQDAADWTQRLPGHQDIANLLRPAYYFAACDWALRDHLLWPLHAAANRQLRDPFAAYFELWRHNAKLRSMGPEQLDVYLPHPLG